MQVFLMRGLPGAGKDTWIRCFEKKHYKDGQKLIVCSADHFRMKNGVYVYVKEEDKKAHDACFEKYMDCLRDYPSTEYLFCNNTNITIHELAPYVRLAEFYDVPCMIVQVLCDVETAIKRNIHKVPAHRIYAMHQTMLAEKLPSHWKVRIATSDGDILE